MTPTTTAAKASCDPSIKAAIPSPPVKMFVPQFHQRFESKILSVSIDLSAENSAIKESSLFNSLAI